jgi:transposase
VVEAPWRDVPAHYGRRETVCGLFRRWQRDGTWKRILARLQAQADAEGMITWDVGVDFTITRAHQHVVGARKEGSSAGTSRPCRP